VVRESDRSADIQTINLLAVLRLIALKISILRSPGISPMNATTLNHAEEVAEEQAEEAEAPTPRQVQSTVLVRGLRHSQEHLWQRPSPFR
jgi:hypothetical protein